MKTAGIYIHIPFCKSKCIYCDFYSVTDRNAQVTRFIKAMVNEINTCPVETTDWVFDTIFIGGGTPSLLDAKHIKKIFSSLNKKFDLSNVIEFTIEVNPGEAPIEILRDFRSLGINRLSIGVQSFQSKHLQFLSRTHSVEDVYRTFQLARSACFENINCDLIYNIPGQSLDDWQNDLDIITQLAPEHISAYSLTVEQNTKLHELVIGKQIKMPEDEFHKHFNSLTYSTLAKNSYHQYEISNYAKNGKECFHNLHYWNNDSYLGFGPSAHGYDGINRWNNYSNLDKYLTLIEEIKLPIETSAIITETERTNEIIGFGLRMTKGFDISRIPTQFQNQFQKQLKQAQNKYPAMIININNQIKLTQLGMNFADAIAVELLL